VLLPPFLAAHRRPQPPQWTIRPDPPDPVRHRALAGQLLLVLAGVGLLAGGAGISVVGLGSVFVPTDLDHLHTTSAALHGANPHLVPFIAHDRAAFGGTLVAAAVGIMLLAAWGFRAGEAWVWWTLALAAAAGFLPAIAAHAAIGYAAPIHVAPLYAGAAVTAIGLALARPYLCARTSRA
jgi:hypothetical protein